MRVMFKRFSVIAGFGILVLVLIAGIVATRRQLAVQSDAQFWVAHTREVLFELETTESLLKDAETGQRGYLLTGDVRYLEPYNTALTQFSPHLTSLARLTKDNPRQVAAVAELRGLAGEKLAELQQTVDLYRQGKQEDARKVVLSDRGKEIMDRVRGVIGGMRSEEERLGTARDASFRKSVRLTIACVYVVGSLGIAGLCFLALFIVREIDLRDRHTQEIRAQEERFRVTLTSIGDGVIATDRIGIVTFLNPVAEMLTGRTAQHAAGRPISEVFPIFSELTGAASGNPVSKVIAEGRIVGLANHTVLERPDGTRIPIEDSAAPIRDDQDRLIGVVLVFRDATNDRKTQDLLRRAEKLSAAARLSAAMAHEINNPLEAVSNLIYLAKQAPEATTALTEQLTMAEHELARVAHITRQTLGFYRESGERAPLDLAAILDSTLPIYKSKLQAKSIQLQRNYETCPPVLGVAGELRQALANLVSNAVDAVGEHGRITLSVRPVQTPGGSAAEVLIEDDGPGVPTEHLAQIFEPFFTTKKETGTGLGLYVTREILERHGGSVAVSPSSNHGSRGAAFLLSLPCEADEEATLNSPDRMD